MLIQNASWITKKNAASTVNPVFRRTFIPGKPVLKASLEVTCDGVYEAVLNGKQVGNLFWRRVGLSTANACRFSNMM